MVNHQGRKSECGLRSSGTRLQNAEIVIEDIDRLPKVTASIAADAASVAFLGPLTGCCCREMASDRTCQTMVLRRDIA
jgi:hypothetical protein